jgi:glucose-6-phosphate 1-dehydrogenase
MAEIGSAATTGSLLEHLAPEAMPGVVAEPATFVIFGGAGDLAHRKLLPALYNLYLDGLLPPRTAIVGVGRPPQAAEAYRAVARDGVEK